MTSVTESDQYGMVTDACRHPLQPLLTRFWPFTRAAAWCSAARLTRICSAGCRATSTLPAPCQRLHGWQADDVCVGTCCVWLRLSRVHGRPHMTHLKLVAMGPALRQRQPHGLWNIVHSGALHAVAEWPCEVWIGPQCRTAQGFGLYVHLLTGTDSTVRGFVCCSKCLHGMHVT